MSRSRWVILSVCLLGFMQVHIHRVGFAPLIPTFMRDLGITYAAAATIMTAYFWTYTAAQLPVGVLADRLGPRRMMLTFLSLLVAGVIAFPLSRDYTQSVVTRGLIGLGAAGIWLPGLRLIHEWFPPQERGRATGLFSAGGGMGGTTALTLVPVLAEHFGWRWGYAMTLLPLLTTLALIYLVVRPGPLAGRRSPAAVPRGTAATLKDVLSVAALWPINVAVLFSYGAFIDLVTFLPAFLMRQMSSGRDRAPTPPLDGRSGSRSRTWAARDPARRTAPLTASPASTPTASPRTRPRRPGNRCPSSGVSRPGIAR